MLSRDFARPQLTKNNESKNGNTFRFELFKLIVALSRKDVDLLDSHIRDKRISCNLTAEKHEITSYKIHASHVFINSIYLALCHDILQLIRAGKPKQMPQS